MTRIYAVTGTDTSAKLSSFDTGGALLDAGYTSMATLRVGNSTVLYAFDSATKKTDVYELTNSAPFIKKVVSGSDALDLFAWDSIKSFTLGNRPYLLTYEKKGGTMGFYEVGSDYSLSAPYTFVNRRDWPTKNFSEVTPFVSLGLVYVLGYDVDSGTVAIYSLNVVATGPAGAPPLLMLNVWYHHWAKGWQDFAFFTLGQSNFFFKINKMKLNVNIDHIQDNPAMGTVEIGSWLQAQLPNAMDVTLDAIVPWKNGEILLTTYDDKTHKVNLYRIHPDCEGWTTLDTADGEASAQICSYTIGSNSYILFYA